MPRPDLTSLHPRPRRRTHLPAVHVPSRPHLLVVHVPSRPHLPVVHVPSQSTGQPTLGATISQMEHRAIRLPQLRALTAHIARRCVPPSLPPSPTSTFPTWQLCARPTGLARRPSQLPTPHAPPPCSHPPSLHARCVPEAWHGADDLPIKSANATTLYDATVYVIQPATRARRCSYVELVANGPQPPTLTLTPILISGNTRTLTRHSPSDSDVQVHSPPAGSSRLPRLRACRSCLLVSSSTRATAALTSIRPATGAAPPPPPKRELLVCSPPLGHDAT
jgi:hypothetical protein